MQQLEIPMSAARKVGERAAHACTAKAERVTKLDTEAAAKFIVGWLRRHGRTSGEALVNAAVAHGFHAHDARAFGTVFAMLARRGEIRWVGHCDRVKGHGTSGGRVWAATQRKDVK